MESNRLLLTSRMGQKFESYYTLLNASIAASRETTRRRYQDLSEDFAQQHEVVMAGLRAIVGAVNGVQDEFIDIHEGIADTHAGIVELGQNIPELNVAYGPAETREAMDHLHMGVIELRNEVRRLQDAGGGNGRECGGCVELTDKLRKTARAREREIQSQRARPESGLSHSEKVQLYRRLSAELDGRLPETAAGKGKQGPKTRVKQEGAKR